MKCGACVADSVFVSAQLYEMLCSCNGVGVVSVQLHEMRCRCSGFSVCECSVLHEMGCRCSGFSVCGHFICMKCCSAATESVW